MTVSSTTRKVGPFIGNGSATTFAFPFKIFEAEDLLVVRLEVATGIETELLLDADYGAALNFNQNADPGGQVTLPAPLAVGFNLIISSDHMELQEADITNQGGFYPAVITAALDGIIIDVQQLKEQADRSLRFPISDPPVNAELPPAGQRRNGFLYFGDDGGIAFIGGMSSQVCKGSGSTFTAPGPVVTVFYGPLFQRPGIDYTLTNGGTTINFTFQAEPGSVYAQCFTAAGPATPPATGLAPVIPSSAISSGILDAVEPWLSTHDPATPGTSTGTSTYLTPYNGRQFNFTYTAKAGHRFSLDFAVDTTSQHFCYDLEIALSDPTQVLNMEVDMNQVLGDGRTVIFDCQCAHVSQSWEYNAWTPSAIPGDPQTWGINFFHHVRIFWHRDSSGSVTTWDGVEFDGIYTPFNVPTANTAQSLGWAVGHLVINFQIEGSSSGSGTVNAFGRNITVWRW